MRLARVRDGSVSRAPPLFPEHGEEESDTMDPAEQKAGHCLPACPPACTGLPCLPRSLSACQTDYRPPVVDLLAAEQGLLF